MGILAYGGIGCGSEKAACNLPPPPSKPHHPAAANRPAGHCPGGMAGMGAAGSDAEGSQGRPALTGMPTAIPPPPKPVDQASLAVPHWRWVWPGEQPLP